MKKITLLIFSCFWVALIAHGQQYELPTEMVVRFNFKLLDWEIIDDDNFH